MSLRISLVLVCLFAALPVCAIDGASDETDRAALVKDVRSITAPGAIPGDLVVFGDGAFTVLTGRSGRANLPMFAAARYGSGRLVVGGHEAFFGDEALKNADNAAFARNIAGWLGGGSPAGERVELIGQHSGLRDRLTAAGCTVNDGRPSDLPGALDRIDVLWIDQATLDGAPTGAIDAIRAWVNKRKGGVAITGPAWGWQSINPSRDLASAHGGNRLALPMGIAFAGGMLNARRGEAYSNTPELLANTRAVDALASLEAQSAGTKTLSGGELNQITTVLGEAVSILPDKHGGFVRRVTALCADKGGQIPTAQAPITTQMPFARLKAALDMQSIRKLAPEQVKAHPAAGAFPGAVPADAKREIRMVRIDTSVPEWHGVGLYAPPGEVITVTVPAAIVGKGYGVRIGEHTDTLWTLDHWDRFPEISMSRPLKAETTRIASPFGGTIFVEVPERANAGIVEVTVAGAVAAPRFVRGETTRAQWLDTLRQSPGPWAELQGKLVAISVPSSTVRNLEDPEALMAYWDEVMENCYAFFAAPKRGRPERYCADIQISAGYMHSGYPIMTGEDVAKTFCDLSVLRGSAGIKCWGFYHEMGHNFQRPEWTWAPFGEVTNNLFSLYGTEKMNGAMVGAHPAMTEEQMMKRVHAVAAAPGGDTYYSKDPWYPLTMFWMMRHEFGWEPFTKLFAEFRDLPNGSRPRTELERHNQFLERFSRLTGHNLTNYLRAWGIDFSPEAEHTASAYPEWMPKRWG